MMKSLLLTLSAVVCCVFAINSNANAANSCSADGGFLAGGCEANCNIGQTAWCHAGGFLSGAKCGCNPLSSDPGDQRTIGDVTPGVLDDARDFADYADAYGTANMNNLAAKSATVIAIVDAAGTDADFRVAEDQWLSAYAA